MERCFVFSAGSFYGLRQRPEPGDLVLAADAGFLLCRKLGITPALLLGDFDSMEQPADFASCRRVPVEKDDTDTLLAVRAGLERGCREFHLYGGCGGTRSDHTIANLQILYALAGRDARGYLYDREFVYTALRDGALTLRREVDHGVVSVFAWGGCAAGVTLEGLQYPLRDAVLTPGFPLGVSNHFAAAEAVIRVKEGTLLVGWQTPPI